MTPLEKIQGLFDRSLNLKRQVRDGHLDILPGMTDACARAVAGGGPAKALCDHAFIVPSRETGRIQEIHITAGHAPMEPIEDDLLARGAIRRTGG